jgi:hypothetical protein
MMFAFVSEIAHGIGRSTMPSEVIPTVEIIALFI